MNVDRFIGIPYSARHFDCADLAILVQRELFGREVPLVRPRPLREADQAEVLAAHCRALGKPTTAPQDGDAVLMRDVGSDKATHIGTWFFLGYSPCVLHTSHKLGASVLHRVQDLGAYGLQVEGCYQWL